MPIFRSKTKGIKLWFHTVLLIPKTPTKITPISKPQRKHFHRLWRHQVATRIRLRRHTRIQRQLETGKHVIGVINIPVMHFHYFLTMTGKIYNSFLCAGRSPVFRKKSDLEKYWFGKNVFPSQFFASWFLID